MRIRDWGENYETSDSRKIKNLTWIRQGIMTNSVEWARLWLKADAAEIWAGWTAVVLFAAQSHDRGSIASIEDIALLSRVPVGMIQKGLQWGVSAGFVDSPDDLPELPDDLPEEQENSGTTLHNRQDRTGQDRTETGGRVAGSAEIVVQAWNSSVEGTNLPKARETTPRRRTIATRLKEKGWIEDFRIAAAFVASSPFHCGDNDRKWTATIDYLLQAGKATELAEKQKAIAPARQFEISAPPLTEADLEAARRL